MVPVILAIESSCDETSAAVVCDGKVLNNVTATQSVHRKYGGVVPELASRAHQQNIVQVVKEALQSAGISHDKLSAIAFTRGPGLMGSLLVGVSFAKGMALALDIPLIEVNHIEAHVLAHFIKPPFPAFPFLCLIASGGHTQLVIVHSTDEIRVIGETHDDAAGEAFDKAAKIMGLPYPGGPLIDQLAKSGNPMAFRFADTSMPGLDFSFSGIKTSFLYFIRDRKLEDPAFVEKNQNDICASFQSQIVKMLLTKVDKASRDTGIREVGIAGGVSANSGLRAGLAQLGKERGWNVFVPDFEYCTDNAAMIAIAAHFKFLKNKFCDLSIAPAANLAVAYEAPVDSHETGI